MRHTLFAALCVLALACTTGPVSTDATPTPTPATTPDPFAPLSDTSEGLTNVSADLDALLENGALEGACDAWKADRTDTKKKLMCGKYMFFYESFGTIGVPKTLVTFLLNKLTPVVGEGFAAHGMVADPFSADGLPLGMAGGGVLGDNVETLAYTCASCHFGQLPDGRYAVGAANHDYDYGGQILAITLFPALASPGADASEHDAAAVARVQPIIDAYQADSSLQLDFLIAVLPLLGLDPNTASFTKEVEGQYAMWPTGTMDFVIPPVPFNDEVHTVSRIISLWAIPEPSEVDDALLSWTGSAPSLMDFVRGFGTLGEGDPWADEDLEPLVDYIHSLRAPDGAGAPDLRGEEIFVDAGCITCHGGPRGSSLGLYDYDEIGTDSAMQSWMDPDLNGVDDTGMGARVTHQLKAPRLEGLWTQTRFLHNGAVNSLEDLLCMNGPRGGAAPEPLDDRGHTYGCELSADDKQALVNFLNSH